MKPDLGTGLTLFGALVMGGGMILLGATLGGAPIRGASLGPLGAGVLILVGVGLQGLGGGYSRDGWSARSAAEGALFAASVVCTTATAANLACWLLMVPIGTFEPTLASVAFSAAASYVTMWALLEVVKRPRG